MASFAELSAAAPDLAAALQRRFDAVGLAFLATLRRDGSPRITGIETTGMMPRSRKAEDLLRDPRCALHVASTDKNVKEGDAKLAGRALEVTDAEVKARFPAPPGEFHLFRLDITEASFLQPAGDHLAIDVWTEAGGLRRVDRY